MNKKALALATKINKKHGDGTVILGSEMLHQELPRMTSGVLSLDVALGGGWVANQIIECVGDESSGKTLLLYVTIAANQKRDPEWSCVWFAAETFVPTYAEMWGVDMDRIQIIPENTLETVYQMVLDYLEERAVDCIVIDSLPALVAGSTEESTMEDVEVALEARINSRFLSKSGPAMRRSLVDEDRPFLFFIVNQWREKVGVRYGDPRTTPGGRKLRFAYFMRVDIRRDDFITNTKGEAIGQVMRVKNLKNKTAPPQRVAIFDAYVDSGNGFKAGQIDTVKDIVAVGLTYDIITRPNQQVYEVAGQRVRGRDALVEAIRNDRELQRLIRKEVLAVTTMQRPAPVVRKVQRGRTTASKSAARTTNRQAPRRQAASRVGKRAVPQK